MTDDYHVRYQCYSVVWPISNRDFVLLRSQKRGGDGVIHAWDVSTESEKMPEQKGNVRGKVVCAGYCYVPTGENECELTYVMCMDPAGSIPHMVVNAATGKVAKRVFDLSELGKTL